MKDLVPERYALAFRLYPYARSPDQDATAPVRHKAVVVGGGLESAACPQLDVSARESARGINV